MRGGSWDRFLREPISSFSDPMVFTPKPWSPAARLLRCTCRMTVIALIAAVSLLILLYSFSCLMQLL
jgi:hypothetical protein